MTSQKLASHLQVDRYGDFLLTDAIRPGLEVPIVPEEGYRIDVFRDRKAGVQVPVLAASISREHLFDVFLDLLERLGETVDVVLETSHDQAGGEHRDLYREHIDLPVLMSHFCDYEEMLLNDGCTGTAIIATGQPIEVQFDEHKLLIVYARDLRPFEQVMRQHAIPRDDTLKLITEGEHLHSSDPKYQDTFEQLCARLGIGEPVEQVSW